MKVSPPIVMGTAGGVSMLSAVSANSIMTAGSDPSSAVTSKWTYSDVPEDGDVSNLLGAESPLNVTFSVKFPSSMIPHAFKVTVKEPFPSSATI